jgi:hypothetical protein
MWFDEVERIGMQKCTPIGYALNGMGGLVWFFGILSVLGAPAYLLYTALTGTFDWPLLWLLLAPFVLVIVGSLFIGVSWLLASFKSFHYDYERRETTWIQGGEKRSYTISDWRAAESRESPPN